MRINERTGLVYTALFLTVSVGLITQNSDALMASFRGETNVRAVDDVFTVYAGREQRLFVLQNDVDPGNIEVSAITLIGQPVCGTVSQSGGSFVYTNSTSCSGHQSFSYCLNTGLGCTPASVALRIVEGKDPVDSVANGPTIELAGLDAQVDFNNRELEITNVHLGKVAHSETTSLPVSGAKLAKIAAESTAVFARPIPIGTASAVEGNFAMEEIPGFQGREINTDTLVEVAAATETVSDLSPVQTSNSGEMPIAPQRSSELGLLAGNWPSLSARIVKMDLGFNVPVVMQGIDQSPFGTPCSVEFSSTTVEAGMVELDLQAPCLPNSKVDVQHGRLKVTLTTDHIGNLNVEVPAFEELARFQVTLSDGTKLSSASRVPELAFIDRVAIIWQADFDADLHAFEFGARENSNGDVWRGHPRDFDNALRYGGGFVIRLGDQTQILANLVEVYSLPLVETTRSGVVDFTVTATPSQLSCNQDRVIFSLRSRGGRLVGASGLKFQLPDCGNGSQSIVLKNALRDLIIATR